MGYIEGGRRCPERPTMSLCDKKFSCDDEQKSTGVWEYLNDWDKWDDGKKASLFTPMVQFYSDPNHTKGNMGEYVTDKIAVEVLKTGRHVTDIQYQITNNSAITVMVVFSSAYEYIPECMADKFTKWGIEHYLIKY